MVRDLGIPILIPSLGERRSDQRQFLGETLESFRNGGFPDAVGGASPSRERLSRGGVCGCDSGIRNAPVAGISLEVQVRGGAGAWFAFSKRFGASKTGMRRVEYFMINS